MTRRAPLQSGPLAAMAEVIDAHADTVMRAEKLMRDLAAIDAYASSHRVIVIGGIEVGIYERFRFITSDLLPVAAGLTGMDLALEELSAPCVAFSKPQPDVFHQRRAVRSMEKARRKTMPRGRH